MAIKRIAIPVVCAVVTALCAGGLAASSASASMPAALASVPAVNPSGHLDGASVAGTRVTMRGWAADPNVPTVPIRVAVSLDGGSDGTVLGSARRNDVARVYPKFGPQHGFIAILIVPGGTHRVCATAINIGPGGPKPLGCKTVTVAGAAVKPAPPRATRAPIGRMESMVYSAGKVKFTGWSIDPDSVAHVLIDVTIGSSRLASVGAVVARTDIARQYPRFGPYRGFAVSVAAPTAPGNYLGCTTAFNTAAGQNTSLGCRMFTVLPKGEPQTLGTGTAVTAAGALQAQAIASHAAQAGEFPAGASAAARIAIASRALLEQATGRRAAPPNRSGIPKFTVATPAKPVDEQAVMGATPYLGSYPAHPGGRPGGTRAVEGFRNDPLPTPSGAGDGLVGAAPVLPANGTTVRPTLPAYRPGVAKVRAEVALDAALSQIGVPYVYAAAGPVSFDCSGLTMWAWSKAGVDLYHYTGTQATQGVRVTASQLLPGDLILFGGDIHHVGMYLGAGYMINAPYTGAYVRVDKIANFGDFSLAVRP